MRSNDFLALTIFLALLCLPVEGGSQEGAFAFQIQGGWSIPLEEFREGGGGWQGEAGQGPNFGMGFTVPIPGPFGAYLGFGQRYFECDSSVCPESRNWISTGFDVALRLVLGEGRVRSWLQGGLHTHRLEGRLLGPGGKGRRVTSDGGGGVEVGAGTLISLGERTSLSPGVRYGWGEVPFSDRAAMDLRYLVLDLGILMGF